MIKAIIIDDEMHCLKTLSMLLKEYCPDVQVVKLCDSAEDGIEAIKKFKPDLVFLDIEMPHMNGFEMLEKFSEISFVLGTRWRNTGLVWRGLSRHQRPEEVYFLISSANINYKTNRVDMAWRTPPVQG